MRRLRTRGIDPVRQPRYGAHRNLEDAVVAQPAQSLVGAVMGERDRHCPVVVQVRERPIAGKAQRKADGRVDRRRRGGLAQLVLPGDVGGAAVAALGGRANRAGEPAGPAGRVDDKTGGERAAVNLDTGGEPPLAQQLVDMTGDQRDPGLGFRRVAEHSVKRRPPAQQRRGSPIRCDGHVRPGGRQIVEHIRHFGPQRLHDRSPKGMGVVELHNALALPDAMRRRPGVAVDDYDVTAAPGQCNGDEQTGRPGADDDGSHAILQFAVT